MNQKPTLSFIHSHSLLIPLEKLNLKEDHFLQLKKNTPVYIVCGRSEELNKKIGVDFLLSSMPWSKNALNRAQFNLIDFGCGEIPCITIEDLILSKLYSLKNQSTRFMDLDDLRSIFESKNIIDWAYVKDQVIELKLTFPKALKPFIPKNIFRKIKK